ncbi:hypothetical protein [Candidatus Galacturonibacter soehngenii]|uniref:Lipoprotein n=1 Tax=Candidatus Galacturonatibacter soehngenii TaxID=2307010 RepID=A0A7V7QK31_9FIRM|nr:hypothetical protein [Candidatus Galacturonibacter soehngenii]KAB1438102.1 hypothetical protein F7O84_11115 [Candidatus Galacturonibacter soehngenii]
MKKTSIVTLAFVVISLLTACYNNNLPEIEYNSDGSFDYNGKTYIFLGSSTSLEKGKQLAYMKDESGIITQVREIKNYSTGQWLLTISKTLMGDWALFGEENIEYIPYKFTKGNIKEYKQTFTFKDKEFQLFSTAPSNLEVQSKIGDVTIAQEKNSIFTIEGYNEEQWLILTKNKKKYYLYKELNVDEIPIEFYKYAWFEENEGIQEE